MRNRKWIALLLIAGGLLAGCDVDTDVSFNATRAADGGLDERISGLEEDVERQRARADRLQTELDALRETSFVRTGDDQFSFRLNAAAAWVLAVAVLAIAGVWVARIKYTARPAERDDL